MNTSSRGRWSRCLVALGLACAGLLVVSLSAQPPPSQEQPPRQEQQPLPEGLRQVPPHAMAFVHVRVGDFLGSEAGKTLLNKLGADKLGAGFFKEVEAVTGVPLADVESMTLILLEPAGMFGGRQPIGKRPDFFPPDIKIEVPQIKIELPKLPKIELPKLPPKFEDKKFEEKFEEQSKVGDGQGESFVALQPERFPEELADFSGPDAFGPLVVVTAKTPVDRRGLLKRMMLPQRDQHGDPWNAGHRGRDGTALFLSDRSVLVGPPAALMRYANHQARKDAPAPLAPILQLGAKKQLLLAGANPLSFAQHMMLFGGRGPLEAPPGLTALYPLTTVSSAGLTAELGQTAELSLHLRCANERHAALTAEAAKTMLVMLDLGLEHLVTKKEAGLVKAKKPSAATLDLVQRARKAVGSATVKQTASSRHQGQPWAIDVQARMDIDPATITAAISEIIGNLQQSGQRAVSINNLKQIGLAMHNHHSAFNGLPPAAITSIKDKGGKPLLSWRVALLPYIEQDALYRRFKLDEPWDSDHNKKLIEQMPPIYAAPGIETKERGLTHYQVFVGPGTVFEPFKKDGSRINVRLQQIQDGTSNTLMVVEAAEPVIWSKPEDLPFDPQQPLPKLGGLYGDGFHMLLCDGSVRFVSSRVPEATLRLLIIRNDGQVIPPY